jgi:hypothetical protein
MQGKDKFRKIAVSRSAQHSSNYQELRSHPVGGVQFFRELLADLQGEIRDEQAMAIQCSRVIAKRCHSPPFPIKDIELRSSKIIPMQIVVRCDPEIHRGIHAVRKVLT